VRGKRREPAGDHIELEESGNMNGFRTLVLHAAVLGLAALPAAASAPGAGQRAGGPVLEPCALEGVAPPAECGTLRVREDRAGEDPRWIELKIVRLGPTGPARTPDPLVVVLGGPGSSATASAAGIARQFADVRAERPLLLVDQRGTGGSNPLECDLYPGTGTGRLAGDLFPAEVVRACVESLRADADLGQYSTVHAVEDLEEVRRALGHDRINLYGISYGTRVVLDYLRRHPGSVRSAVLHGVIGPGQLGRHALASNAQRALDGVLQECEASDGCRTAFPAVREQARTVFDRLRQEAREVEVLDPVTGTPARILLSADLAAEAVRYMLYSPRTAGLLPLVLSEAARGDLEAVAEFAVFGRQHIVNSGGNGLFLSITCSEDLAVGDPSAARRRAEGTFWSDYTFRQLFSACEHWPRAAVPDEFHTPVAFAGPVLLISGEWDPATPPSQGAEAAAGLPGSLHVVVPHGGHDFEGLANAACVDAIVKRFLDRPSPDELDTTCVGTIERAPFFTEPLPMRALPVDRAALARLAGTYASAAVGLTLAVEMDGDRLRLLLPGGPAFPLVAVEPGRFRTAGFLGTYFRFETDADGVRSLFLEQPGAPPLHLARGEDG
jgi:pimeloyl-ACP methyl ester carboxylesterase